MNYQMSIREKLDLRMQSLELEKTGNFIEAEKLQKQIPLPPYLAKSAKKHLGTDYLIHSGWNLSEANAEYGQDWLTR